jgi:cell division septum initiation protein DivIVA
VDIHDTLQEAITILESGRPRAFGAGVVVDRDRLLQLLQHARETLPEEILAGASILAQRTQIMTAAGEEAEHIRRTARDEAERIREEALSDADAVRTAAETEAGNLRAQAQVQSEQLVDEHEVLREAQLRADELLHRASQQSTAMRSEVEAYVDAKLAAIAATLAKTLDTVEAGRRKMRASAEVVDDETVVLP